MVDYWAKAPMAREQIVLFAPTLDEMLAEDHPVRLMWDILEQCDWSSWEAEYNGRIGQPPIHPEVMAGLILYGLSLGIRSSRQLEYVTGSNIDFIWLAEGRSIDHSTFCDFRTKFKTPLKDMFLQVGKIARSMGLINLGEVTLDGTRVKANNGRFDERGGVKVKFRVYRCAACSGCPLVSACTQATTKHGRQISRDEHERIREEMAKKMATPEAKKKYARRLHAGETPFAFIKQIIGLRQFLLRGLEKVKTEWLWACTAFNVMKLVRITARLRAEVDKLQAEPIT